VRDDLHKGTSLPRIWKSALRSCLRDADEGPRSRARVNDALRDDIDKLVSRRGLNLIQEQCKAPSLPLGDDQTSPVQKQNTQQLAPAEQRILDSALSRMNSHPGISADQAVRDSLKDLTSERLAARRGQAESQLLKRAPQHAKGVGTALRKNFHADVSQIVDQMMHGKISNSKRAKATKLDPDDDLR